MTRTQSAPLAAMAGLTPAALTHAAYGNVVALWGACCAQLPGAELHDDADVLWFTTGNTAAPWLNQVLAARFDDDALDEQIERALAPFKERRLPMLWSLGPSTRPADLGARLAGRGLSKVSAMPAMAIDLDALGDVAMPPAFEVVLVDSDAAVRTWGDTYIRAFEMPEAPGRVLLDAYARMGFAGDSPARHYVGLLDGEPVASATLFIGGGVAGVWHVGTMTNARRQGIGAAMTLAPLQRARTLGYRVGTLYASEMGESVYRRLGFVEYGRMEQYQWSPRR
ncbi:MAG: GNAT family N-acetyltransferase [Dehalococcoidia bacterium]